MLKWTRRVLIGVAVLAVVVLLSGVGYERWSRRSIAQAFPPPGELIEHGGRTSHLHCIGSGAPTVILEAGLDTNGSGTWTSIQPLIAEVARVCSYDRAGFMWSEPRADPRDADRVAEELHALLQAASEPPPYVLVGHSLGGLFARVYTQRFPDEVSGIVLVDASHPDQYDRYPPEILTAIAEVESSFPSAGWARLMVTIGAYRLQAPEPVNSNQAYLWRSVPWGLLGETAAWNRISEQASEAGTLGDRPLVVLTAGFASPMPGVADDVLDQFYTTWIQLQRELAALSTNADHRIVEGASHYIHLDAPDAVVEAVEDVVQSARQGVDISVAPA